MKKNIVLITGMPRSGTTPIGERFTNKFSNHELYEPMNLIVGDKAIENQFEILNTGKFNTAKFEDFLLRMQSGKIRAKTKIQEPYKRNRYFNRTKRTIFNINHNPFVKNIIWKDPFAFFLVPYILEQTNIKVIVTIRSPLAIAGSFKRMKWDADIDDLKSRLSQSVHKASSIDDTGDISKSVKDATLLWNLIYTNVLKWIEQDLNITIVEASENINDPIKLGNKLKNATGLPVQQPKTKIILQEHTSNHELPNKAHIKKRNIDSVNSYWRRILSDEEIDYCNKINNEIWQKIREKLEA